MSTPPAIATRELGKTMATPTTVTLPRYEPYVPRKRKMTLSVAVKKKVDGIIRWLRSLDHFKDDKETQKAMEQFRDVDWVITFVRIQVIPKWGTAEGKDRVLDEILVQCAMDPLRFSLPEKGRMQEFIHTLTQYVSLAGEPTEVSAPPVQ